MASNPNSLHSLIERIEHLPPARRAEVEDFVEFLEHKDQDRGLVRAATQASQGAFAKAWENPDDSVYDAL